MGCKGISKRVSGNWRRDNPGLDASLGSGSKGDRSPLVPAKSVGRQAAPCTTLRPYPGGVLELQGGDPGDVEELRLLGAGGAEAFPDGTEVLGGLDSKDDAGDQEEGAPPQAEPEGVPGVSHHVTQDHTAAVQGSREGLAGGNALSHLLSHPGHVLGEVAHLPLQETLTFIPQDMGGPGRQLFFQVSDSVQDT